VPQAAPFVRPDPEAHVTALTRRTTPGPTFPLILASVSIAVLALHLDDVARYSQEAFWAALALTIALAWAVGRLVATTTGRARVAAATVLPALGGAFVGMVVQAIVWVNQQNFEPVKDLGGLVDTTEPFTWIAGGVVLGGVPALAVSLFLGLAARALRTLIGHDAPEAFSVGFTGASGLVGAFGLLVVRPSEAAPLLVVVFASFVTLVVALLVDGARLRFLRQAFTGADGAFEIVPASLFANDKTLAPMVAQAGAARVLLRVDRCPGSYRSAAAEPVALLGDTEEASTGPLRRRRVAAVAMLFAIGTLTGLAALVQGLMV
jgi:hypothetical protein